MDLSPLSRDEVALLARRTLGPEPVDRELTDWLFDQTRGNPLLAGSLLEELAADPARRVVPASVRERVRRMGAGLPDDEREVLDLAAVLGRSFELRTVARLLPDGAEALDRLTEKGLLVWVADGSPVRYEFIHPRSSGNECRGGAHSSAPGTGH
jgi:predicted ATPase